MTTNHPHIKLVEDRQAGRKKALLADLAQMTVLELRALYIATGENMMESEMHHADYQRQLALIDTVAEFRFGMVWTIQKGAL